MKNLFKEFKEFAVKGNMIDIAIGVIIGAAFNKVVDVIVKEVFMPPLSLLTDGLDYASRKIVLREAVTGEGGNAVDEIAIGYGKLIEVSIDFLIIAISVFVVVKFMNRLKNKAQDTEDVTVQTPKDIELLDKVTKLLEKQNELLQKQE